MAYLNSNGSFRTSSLFKETFKPSHRDMGLTPVMSLDDARQIYVNCADPTGYKAAMLICDGSWAQWQRLKDWPYFRDEILPKWEHELEVKLRSDAISKLLDVADDPRHGKHVQCSQWLAEGRWKGGAARGPGRPTESESKRNKKVTDDIAARHNSDAKRLGLH